VGIISENKLKGIYLLSSFLCPLCREMLENENNTYHCKNNHSFDIAKSGYVNLLPVQKKHSKSPGDNKLMVETRNQFLNKGYYNPLLTRLCEQVKVAVNSSFPLIVDAGCGEGYYTTGVCESLEKAGFSPNILGVDLSKDALKIASRRAKVLQNIKISFAVASIFDIPIADGSADILIEIFAPYSGTEFARVLKKGGKMVLVIPAERHLYQLKQAIYTNPYKNEVKDYNLEGFRLESKVEVDEMIHLQSNEDINNLFTMTPYYYKTSKEDTQRLSLLDKLSTTIAFEILTYIKL